VRDGCGIAWDGREGDDGWRVDVAVCGWLLLIAHVNSSTQNEERDSILPFLRSNNLLAQSNIIN
jgi:hypothetical protein